MGSIGPTSNGNPSGNSNVTHETGSPRPLLPGIYIPTLAFFDPITEELDLQTTTLHAIRLAKAGISGIAVQGSNGEAVHLSDSDRNLITRTTRAALDSNGFNSLPVIVGCGAQSTRETIALCHDAADFGGDYALVLPPSYFKGLFSKTTILEFFLQVAGESPLPIIIYNYPGGASGLDLDSDTLIRLGQHENIIGCKFTCGNTGKMTRVASAFNNKMTGQPTAFHCFGGSGDFTLQTLISGGVGIIGGIANIAPRTCVKLMRLWKEGKMDEARQIQQVLARGDWAAIQSGVVGTRAALVEYYGYGGWCRKPLPRPQGSDFEAMVENFGELVGYEKTCA
jgi:4-hydroxy-2-oxoglutarate aldolase